MEITPEQAIAAYEETGLRPGARISNCAIQAVYLQIHNLKSDAFPIAKNVYSFINNIYGDQYGEYFGLGFDVGIEGKELASLRSDKIQGYIVGKAVKEYFEKKSQTPDTELTPQKKEELVLSSV